MLLLSIKQKLQAYKYARDVLFERSPSNGLCVLLREWADLHLKEHIPFRTCYEVFPELYSKRTIEDTFAKYHGYWFKDNNERMEVLNQIIQELELKLEPSSVVQDTSYPAKFAGPDITILLNEVSPVVISILITTLRDMGVKVYGGTREFDYMYPYLYWDSETLQVSQTSCLERNSRYIVVNDPVQFLEYVTGKKAVFKPVEVGKLGDYTVTMLSKEGDIYLDDTFIPFKELDAVYQAVLHNMLKSNIC